MAGMKVPVYDQLGQFTTREYTPEGYLRAVARFARTGIQLYARSEIPPGVIPSSFKGSFVRVLRDDSEVFDEASMASFVAKPVTVDHRHKMIDVTSFRIAHVGLSLESVRKEEVSSSLMIPIVVTDSAAIKSIEKGKVQLSAGYTCDYQWGPAEHPTYGAFDLRMTNIRGNHISIVDKGRAGPGVQILDQESKGQTSMKKRKINGIVYDFDAEVVDGVDELLRELETSKARVSALEKELDEASKGLAAAKTDLEKTTGQMDSLTSELAQAKEAASDEAIAKRAQARQAVLDHAKSLCEDLGDVTKMSLGDIRKATVSKVAPHIVLDGKSDEYVDAVFETLQPAKSAPAASATGVAGLKPFDAPAGSSVLDAYEGPVEKARREVNERRKQRLLGA